MGSPCPFCKNPCYLKCGNGHGTVDAEALILRGTSNWTMQWSWTLSHAHPPQHPLHGSTHHSFSALWFISGPISISKFRLSFFSCASWSAAIALWVGGLSLLPRYKFSEHSFVSWSALEQDIKPCWSSIFYFYI